MPQHIARRHQRHSRNSLWLFARASVISMLLLIIPSLGGAQTLPNSTATTPRLYTDNDELIQAMQQSAPDSPSVWSNKLLFAKLQLEPPLYVPLNRAIALLDAKEPACLLNRLHSAARDERYDFSLPVNFYQAQMLFAQPQYQLPAHVFSSDQQQTVLSVSAAVNALKHSRILRISGFSYGDAIDRDFDNINPAQIYLFEAPDPYAKIGPMFDAGKIDWLLVPAGAITNSEKLKQTSNRFNIAGQAPFITGHLMCNRNDQTRAFLQSANVVLRQLYRDSVYLKAHQQGIHSQDWRHMHAFIQSFGQSNSED